MWFGEPHPFPERGSPTRLSASRQQSYEGWSCRIYSATWRFYSKVQSRGMCAFLVNVLPVFNHHASRRHWSYLTLSRRRGSHVTNALFIALQSYSMQLQTQNLWIFLFVSSAVPGVLLHNLAFKLAHKHKAFARTEVRWMGRPQTLPVILSRKSL